MEQVCEWLELVGLGTYRDRFRGKQLEAKYQVPGLTVYSHPENRVNGATLVNMDVHVFGKFWLCLVVLTG